MDARFYNSEEIDIERLAQDIVNVYVSQGYQAQHFGNRDQELIQLKKGGDFEAIIGMQAALSLTLQRTAGGTLAMIGQQKWLDKAAVGAVGIVALWPLAVTAGVGALRQASLANQVLNIVDGLVHQQRPGVLGGPAPMQLLPQIQQQWSPPPYAPTPAYVPPPQMVAPPAVPRALPPPASSQDNRLRCASCNTPYEAGDTFCTGCGRSLAPAKQYCGNCNAELKPGASFCPKCGTSTYQAPTSSQAAAPSTSAASPTPVYTPPTPVYTPPTPVYTPPTPDVEPTIVEQAPPVSNEPTEPYYVPPVPQAPPVVPQPKVTLVPGASQSEPKVVPPPRPQTPYYTPPSQSVPPTVSAQKPAHPSVPPQPLVATPVSRPEVDPQTPWGSLTFGDGTQISLTGERAVVGRYDHDLGGVRPEVDLGKMQGADTVSRVHATLEHIGSTFVLTDLNSTNATRVNGKRLEPDVATPVKDGDTLHFGKVTSTLKTLRAFE